MQERNPLLLLNLFYFYSVVAELYHVQDLYTMFQSFCLQEFPRIHTLLLLDRSEGWKKNFMEKYDIERMYWCIGIWAADLLRIWVQHFQIRSDLDLEAQNATF
jgi:hypothetical protein